jgi:hypothetical protein
MKKESAGDWHAAGWQRIIIQALLHNDQTLNKKSITLIRLMYEQRYEV